MLDKMKIEHVELKFDPHTGELVGPMENALFKTIYLLIQ